MRILFLAGILPWPLAQGRNLRNYHLLRHLSRDHEIDMFCGFHGTAPPDCPAHVASNWQTLHAFAWPRRPVGRRLRELFHTWPALWQAHYSPALVAQAQALHARAPYDRIHVAGLEMYGCALALQAALRSPVPVVLDEQNIEYQLQQSLQDSKRGSGWDLVYGAYSRMQSRRLRRGEVAAWREAHHVLAVSPEDRQEILKVLSPEKVTLVPNGIDVGQWSVTEDARVPFQMSFMGKMDYRPNVLSMLWFCRHVLPRLLEARAEARLMIVGRDAAPEIQALDRIPEVTVTGYVADIQPYYAQGSLFVLPMFHGGGTRFKVLEALMAGMPLVSTRMGIAGIPLEHGVHCLLADDADAFVEAILALWAEPALGPRLARQGRHLVQAQFDWSVITPALDSVYRA